MDITLKNTSIRCDLHPPLSALMYCDKCRTFLCRICAEVRPGGRVCATCKQACREPSADEFAQLVEQRRKAKQDASLAKAAESRIKDQLEKAKVDRDARLKAEFAARKAALSQPQPSAKPAAPGPSVPSTPSTPAKLLPSHFKPISNSVPLASAAGGTMYDPTAPAAAPVIRDPLAKLSERAHLNVIGRAKNYMIYIGLLTVLFTGIAYFVVACLESNIDASETSVAQGIVDDVKADVRKYRSQEQQAALDAQDAAKRETDARSRLAQHAELFLPKVTLAGSMFVGVALIALFFLCDKYPRGATVIAFVLFLAITAIDVAIFRMLRLGAFLARLGAITALYNGMIAGNTLHKMRVEDADAG